eukprot:11157363-Lingulodinium_polyedra.AAC.1
MQSHHCAPLVNNKCTVMRSNRPSDATVARASHARALHARAGFLAHAERAAVQFPNRCGRKRPIRPRRYAAF